MGRRARTGDARTSVVLDFVGGYLSHGLSILNDVLGPQAIILGGYFGALGEFFVPRVQAVLDAREFGSAGKDRVVMRESGLGFAGVTVGAVQLGLEVLFEPPGSVPGRDLDIVRH